MKDYNLIIERCRTGDKDAFRTIVNDFRQVIFRLAIRIMGNTTEAEDITQETFISAWTAISSYSSRSSLNTWLYRIACNKCYDRLRQMKKETARAEISESIEYIQCDNNIEEEMSNKELCRIISEYTKDMPPMQKLAFTLKDIEGLSSDEICRITGITTIQLKSNLYFARKFIRNRLLKDKKL